MKIFVSQIYVEPKVAFPFTHHFQRLISQKLTESVTPTEEYLKIFGDETELMFRMSARAGIPGPEVKGPTIFKRTQDVEYTVFLPYDVNEPAGLDKWRRAVVTLIQEIEKILHDLRCDTSRLVSRSDQIVEEILSNPRMVSAGWH